ncbi:MAG: IS3 family transposase [Spiribacter salinus]|uniref:IS3 family transposase n=1 Tax=Spiribacter salinus TaxID=1335746 RepID=A0A540V8T6_9GAMM|nr:MAG: IS3 family transposase [Spiribacter salinus]
MACLGARARSPPWRPPNADPSRIWSSATSPPRRRISSTSPILPMFRLGRIFLYLAIVLDVFSRRELGWCMATHLRAELVRAALDMALWQRRPCGVIHHSDQGSQYTSIDFGQRCQQAGVRPSMGSVGDCYDNAMAESFFATLECELIDRHRFRDPSEARQALFEYIEGWYNPHRRHSAIGYVSPRQFEKQYAQAMASPKPEPVH